MTGRRIEFEPDRDISELAAVIADARRHRAPKDAVPRATPAEELPPLPVGPAPVVHTEVITDRETGMPVAVDQFTNTDWIAPAITPDTLRTRMETTND
ncbi:hypothetical protein BN971_03730 [Mycobacterium bohemicum DSM 44277]|uniref:Uncharacterized protein n=2 Tax=Mycobacterium bohemicum TaxID=56425 RepID=A0A1X1R3I2_MYCBE|nr:hypothetical protein [Mycobacterium bohemicum]MCV6968867.1 hypothetical protein [Mycobacterium bohemicum]ORU98769.1 hypothetical protein AWB93_13075 [Mycobacterium bohemicum]CPR12431.1 hypothetical protein BN971_03730 [Mycobacterium bohemicum DSM 44277]